MKIIVNADDFGKSVEINRAINDSYKRGFVNSIGIINAECVQNAVNYIIWGVLGGCPYTF